MEDVLVNVHKDILFKMVNANLKSVLKDFMFQEITA